jgi:DNA-binding NarL/FixJ family response regulator
MGNGEERKAVVLDDQPLWMDALEQLLARAKVRVVGKATRVEHALALIDEQQPDVLIAGTESVDQQDGAIECIARAHERCPGLKSVVLAPDYDARQMEAAFAAGASVYCIKRAAVDDLAVAVRQAFDHSIFLASSQALHQLHVASGPVRHPETLDVLTRRETEILRLVAEGHSNSALAKMLWVTEQTVKFHLANIYRKLNVSNRTEASRWAHVHGVLTPEAHAMNAA